MVATEPSTPARNATLAPLLSTFIPGAGQLYLGAVGRGLLVLLTAPSLVFLVVWSFSNLRVGRLTAGGLNFSWLWLPLVLFWVWNIADAYNLVRGRAAS